MAFLDKLGELARTAADKANDGLEINRINSDIVIQKGNINEYQRELGMYYWARFVMRDQLDEEATAICDKIVKAQDRIKELEAEIEQVKADREAEKAERAEQKRLEAEAAFRRRQRESSPESSGGSSMMYRSQMLTVKWADFAAVAARLGGRTKILRLLRKACR